MEILVWNACSFYLVHPLLQIGQAPIGIELVQKDGGRHPMIGDFFVLRLILVLCAQLALPYRVIVYS